MNKIDIVEQIILLTEEERELLFAMIHEYPDLFKKLLPGTPIIDNLLFNPHGSDHPLIAHFQIWKNKHIDC
jgi:hypothetical protein